ncbi:MAG: hypothetical protein Q7R92_05675 [bacterium]|nr:hypothetical protein [bacterium]
MKSLKFLAVAVVAVTLLSLSGCSGGGGGGEEAPAVASATIGFRVNALAVPAPAIGAFFLDRVNSAGPVVEAIGSPLPVVGNQAVTPFNTLVTGTYFFGFNALDVNGAQVYADSVSTFTAVDLTVITVININGVPLFDINPAQIGYLRIPRLGIFDAGFVISVDGNGSVIPQAFPGGAGGTITVP